MRTMRHPWSSAVLLATIGCSEPSQPGAIGVSVSTAGEDLDLDGYVLQVDGHPARLLEPQEVGILPSTEGPHIVELVGIADNCAAAPDARRRVTVVSGATVAVSFAVSCVGTGVAVSVGTTGADRDHEYRLLLDGQDWGPLPANGVTRVTRLAVGVRSVTLAGVAPNCATADSNPSQVVVAAGTVTPISFAATCAVRWKFAFHRAGWITLASADGSETSTIAEGDAPNWSPDGGKLAFGCGAICILDLQAGELTRLQGNTIDGSPAWRPDGNSIAFGAIDCPPGYDYGCSFVGLFEMDPSGKSRTQVPLPANVTWASDLDWAPSGVTLGFSCSMLPRSGICRVDRVGSNLQVLASASSDNGGPSWAPDGTRIAFHTERFGPVPEIAVMGSDGANVVRLRPGQPGRHPDWSPDGARLVFAGDDGLFLMNADGSGLARLTTGLDHEPAWRP